MKGYLLTSFRQKTLGIQLFKGFFSFRASISPSFLYIHNNTTSIHSRVYFDKRHTDPPRAHLTTLKIAIPLRTHPHVRAIP